MKPRCPGNDLRRNPALRPLHLDFAPFQLEVLLSPLNYQWITDTTSEAT